MLERKSSQRHSSREKHRDLQREVSGSFQDYRDIQYEYQDDRVPTYVSSSYQVYHLSRFCMQMLKFPLLCSSTVVEIENLNFLVRIK